MKNNLKMISVTAENYRVLKKLGGAGDSFNDVITGILKEIGAVKPGELVVIARRGLISGEDNNE